MLKSSVLVKFKSNKGEREREENDDEMSEKGIIIWTKFIIKSLYHWYSFDYIKRSNILISEFFNSFPIMK